MKFKNITLSDLNFVIGAVDFLVYDAADSVDPHNIDTIATVIDAVAMNSQEQDNFYYEHFQNCITRWRKEIEACE